jgi:hypothetical protein
MSLPFALPDWVPWWVPLVLLLPALLYALAFLFMPFSVIGVKARLEVIEARLDEIQNEIRHLALRLPAGSEQTDFEEVYAPSVSGGPATGGRRAEPVIDRPPIPPAPHELARGFDDEYDDRPPPPPHARPGRRAEPVIRQARTEPRLDRRG